jgi:hypothetical protein
VRQEEIEPIQGKLAKKQPGKEEIRKAEMSGS